MSDHTPITDILRRCADHGIFHAAHGDAAISPTLLHHAADEIERLRADNDNLRAALTVKDNHDHFDCTAERELVRLENQRLQALIDAYASSDRIVFHAALDSPEWLTAYAEREQALAALLAAATKEDDRG